MNKPTVADNKPTPVDLKAGEEYYFCTCGKSANQPFCDGSHKGTNFAPKSFVAEEDGEAYLCQCKQTANAPFCDGKPAKGSVSWVITERWGPWIHFRGQSTFLEFRNLHAPIQQDRGVITHLKK